MPRRLAAEFLGTFVSVLAGVGTAVLAASAVAPNIVSGAAVTVGVGYLGVALAFGLGVMAMTYALGHVSGAHLNPAVTLGAAVARRFGWAEVPGYVVAQVLGGLLAGLTVWSVARGRLGGADGPVAPTGWGEGSPGGYTLLAVLVLEVVLTAVLVYVVLGVTDTRSPDGFEPLAIGGTYVLAYLVALPVSGGGLNPARATGVAFFSGGDAPAQLWLFWLAPLAGAAIAGATFHLVTGVDRRDRDITGHVRPEDALVADGVDPDAPR
ncbi:aquaporin [Phycicoccus endophyticus]|uniref:Aquaporin n=2 Tax=Phycicoccus endophyticus TaxID=1690220 RepID=A0A7G9R5J4_9MICO|nr:aquaporin [Phycicoccus endophyticus]QNN50869.1 aquaporin [Phycicoccus endophyticus]GGL29809.1 aquaporin [Phycicoccus endophyticus]